MSVEFDLGAATARMGAVVAAVTDGQLGRPTPCSEWDVARLLEHVNGFTAIFTTNAGADLAPEAAPAEDGLSDDWRSRIPASLGALAAAWRDERAWEGVASAGGFEMPRPHNAVVALEELTVHGWDLARATGQEYAVGDEDLDVLDRFFEIFGEAPFGPPADTPDGATRFEAMLAATGRDPGWQSD